jgi:hypothetical protein
MKFLTNISNHKSHMDWFDNDSRQVEDFLNRNRLDGFELIFHGNFTTGPYPEQSIHGIHMCYWPVWLDFWRGDEKALLRQFQTHDNIKHYYGGMNKKSLIDQCRAEFKRAQELKAGYVVFHVSHVELDHIYDWDFTYNDWDVLKAAAELANEVFGYEDRGVAVLFENLWWPGLNFMSPKLVKEFYDLIAYPRKGFMLDTGHLMITNRKLTDEVEACEYILDMATSLGRLKNEIKGIHLSKSFAGEYLNLDHGAKKQGLTEIEDIWERNIEARKHIIKIDQHNPFEESVIKKVIDDLQPDYVIYELLPKNLIELEAVVTIQNRALGR